MNLFYYISQFTVNSNIGLYYPICIPFPSGINIGSAQTYRLTFVSIYFVYFNLQRNLKNIFAGIHFYLRLCRCIIRA